MRAAVRDVNTKLTGSASQFLEVPKVGSGQLALSGVLLKGLTECRPPRLTVARRPGSRGLAEAVLLEPEVRVLQPGTDAVYAYEIDDGLDPQKSSGLQMGTALLREGKVVYQSPFAPVATAPPQGQQEAARDPYRRQARARHGHAGRSLHPRGHRAQQGHEEARTPAVARFRNPEIAGTCPRDGPRRSTRPPRPRAAGTAIARIVPPALKCRLHKRIRRSRPPIGDRSASHAS